jgi:hypothetical protein
VAMLMFARLADRIGKGSLAIWSAGSQILIAYGFFWFLNTREPVLIWIAMIAWNIAAAALYAVTGVFLADLFETRVRYSGVSFGYQMGRHARGCSCPNYLHCSAGVGQRRSMADCDVSCHSGMYLVSRCLPRREQV